MQKRIRVGAVFFFGVVAVFTFGAAGRGSSPLEIDRKVDQLLEAMSLEEKVGQMTQIAIDVVSKKSDASPASHELDPEKLEAAILKYHVGSIFNVVTGSSAYTIDHWHEVITRIQDLAVGRTAHHIPVLFGIDAIHGATFTQGATLFPQAFAMAATWNSSLLKREGEITAFEVRASGIPWNFYPVLDIGRHPVWPRFWETLGEDVHLASKLGTAYIQGHEGTDPGAETRAGTCMKHFVGYSHPWSGKDRTPAQITERMMREYYLPPFESAIQAGALTLMSNSAEVDGIPGTANDYLLTKVLRDELHFKGFVVSDWEDIKRLHTRDRVASSPEEAVRMAVMAGVDMSMVPLDFSFHDILVKLVRKNIVPLSRIDEAVGRILRVKYQLGLFDRPYPNKGLKRDFASHAFSQENLKMAEEAITVLKNTQHILPISKNSKILITGPTANSLSALNGGWTLTWQGDNDALYPRDKKNILQAIQDKLGAGQVTYVPGTTFNTPIDVAAAAQAAKKVDIAIVCLGEKPYAETAGNIDDLTLDSAQLELAKAVIQTGTPTLLVLVEGRPRVIRSIEGGAQGVVMAYLPGMEGGRALANILFGETNPSGKLPFSYPRYPNSLIPYDHKHVEQTEGNYYNPQYPFGFGLSYTQFKYSDLKINSDTVEPGQDIRVSVTVKNTGNRSGKEVVQLYLKQLYGSVSRPVKQIRGFSKISLEPNEIRTVNFILTPQDLSFIGRENKRIIEAGEYKILIDSLEKSFVLNSPKTPG